MRAVTYCDVLSLSKEHFDYVLSKFPREGEIIKRVASQRLLKDKKTRLLRKLPLLQNVSASRLSRRFFFFVCLLSSPFSSCSCRVPLAESRQASAEFTDALLNHLEPANFEARDYIVRAGELGDSMFFLGRGFVEVLDADGALLTSLSDGALFGEMALLFKEPRSYFHTGSSRLTSDAHPLRFQRLGAGHLQGRVLPPGALLLRACAGQVPAGDRPDTPDRRGAQGPQPQQEAELEHSERAEPTGCFTEACPPSLDPQQRQEGRGGAAADARLDACALVHVGQLAAALDLVLLLQPRRLPVPRSALSRITATRTVGPHLKRLRQCDETRVELGQSRLSTLTENTRNRKKASR